MATVGDRYVIDSISGPTSLYFRGVDQRYYIVDRDTDEPMKGRKRPDGVGPRVWFGTEELATIYARELNSRAGLPADPRSPPASPRRRRSRTVRVDPFHPCAKCSRMVKEGHDC